MKAPNFGEPGFNKPLESWDQTCWDVFCPVDYCGASPGFACMNNNGRFSQTHIKRRFASYIKKKQSGTENELREL